MKVLIVEDEVLVRKGLVMGIDWSEIGFQDVLEAGNGVEALAVLKHHKVDLMLTDIIMPKMDGLSLIKEVHDHYSDVAIVVLSCVNDVDSIREAMRYNRALDYIPKLSISPDGLKENIKSLMQSIQLTSVEEEQITETVYFMEDELKLQEMLKTRNEDGFKAIVHDVLDRVGDNNFNEWVDIYALLNRQLKISGSYITDLDIDGLTCFDYIAHSNSIRMLSSHLTHVISVVFKQIELNDKNNYGDDITKAIQYIHAHFNDSIKLADVASHIGMNENYLSSLFKQATGTLFSDFVNKTRIAASKKLLEETEDTIYEIADLVGYSSESYYSKIFKSFEGKSPNAYRKMMIKFKNM